MQGQVFSARNTMQYMSISIGNFLGGIYSDIFQICYGTSKERK